MKCRISYPVVGHLRFQKHIAVPHAGWEYGFVTDKDGVVVRVGITISVPNKGDWPRASGSPKSGVKLHLKAHPPGLPLVRSRLLAMQGVLSLYGLERIDFRQEFYEWLPETPEEKAELEVYSFGMKVERSVESVPFCPLEIFIRSVLAVDGLNKSERWLNLFRRAHLRHQDGDYLDAVRCHYFILEGLFGGGKYRQKDVTPNMISSNVLRKAFDEAVRDETPVRPEDAQAWEAARAFARKAKYEGWVRHVVALRGRLQHHGPVGPKSWHPEEQDALRGDAILLSMVNLQVLFEEIQPAMWNPSMPSNTSVRSLSPPG